jgi:hypothetical protein
MDEMSGVVVDFGGLSMYLDSDVLYNAGLNLLH